MLFTHSREVIWAQALNEIVDKEGLGGVHKVRRFGQKGLHLSNKFSPSQFTLLQS